MPKRRTGKTISYRESGVDIKAAERVVDDLKKKVPGIGGFGGLFPLHVKEYREPVLVSSTDGVGTKLLVAGLMNNHETIGIDLVAMVVNDIIVCGAEPLFFLDYFSTGKLKPARAEQILSGVMQGCDIAGCPLIGGETAELPGLYSEGHYDLAGFGVGVVEKNEIIDGSAISEGDVFIGLRSSGIHSNGYSLARKVLIDKENIPLKRKHRILGERPGEALLRPTMIYAQPLKKLRKKFDIQGIAHITGGGIPGNLNRILPENIDAEINADTWTPHPVFQLIMEKGPVSREEMFLTFNMGVGMILCIGESDSSAMIRECKKLKIEAYKIGKAVKGKCRVRMEYE